MDRANDAYSRRDFRASVALSEQAVKVTPESGVAWNNLCAALCELGRWDEAVRAGERAVACAPEPPLFRNNLAWARQGRQAALKGARK